MLASEQEAVGSKATQRRGGETEHEGNAREEEDEKEVEEKVQRESLATLPDCLNDTEAARGCCPKTTTTTRANWSTVATLLFNQLGP